MNSSMTVQTMHVADEQGKAVCGAAGTLWSDVNWEAADSDWSFRRCERCVAVLGTHGIERLARRRRRARRRNAAGQAG